MSGELRNFDPDLVTVTWALPAPFGSIDLTEGLIDGPGAIAETKDNPRSTRRGDRQGNYVRNRRRQKGGTLALTYVAEAEIQAQLTAIVIADDISQTMVGALTVRDLNGNTIMRYDGAHIEDDPTFAAGDTAADRVYTFGYAKRTPFIGGAEAVT